MQFQPNQWGLILGGSSGIGLASAKKLSSQGMSLCLVHRDRRGAMARIEKEFETIRSHGHGFISLNLDALSEAGQSQIISSLQEAMGQNGKLKMLLHSIAFGNLKPLAPVRRSNRPQEIIEELANKLGCDSGQLKMAVAETFDAGGHELASLLPPDYPERLLEEEDMSHTIYSMGTSLSSWVQKLFAQNVFQDDARILSLTSEGNSIAWKGYAAVAAAKSALESVSRALAVEFAPWGLRSNVIQAGITETPALQAIPGSKHMKSNAILRNPFRRLTQPEDVANVVSMMCSDEAAWINGTIIRADGGEHISSN